MTTTAPMSPNSWPISAKMKSLKAFGHRHQALAEAAAEEPAGAQGQQPLDGVEASRPAGPTTGRARSGCAPSGSRAGRAIDGRQHGRRAQRRRGGARLAPATKNIVNAVRVMTVVVPRSGSLNTSRAIGRDDDQERDRPAPEAADLRAALGEPVGEVDDQRQLGDLGRVDGRQRAELEPARRAADDDVRGSGTKTRTSRTTETTRNGTDTRRR